MNKYRETSTGPDFDPPRKSDFNDPWIGMTLASERSYDHWQLVRSALRDLGYPVAGWSHGRRGHHRMEITLKGEAKAVREAILDWWKLEGYPAGVLIVRIDY